ncbi:hypothetical protein Zmor_018526 [Zophobas morio]|uniref:Uncharacterized protein n=1 Tax=Zophobas morio TaxID=2755281 RepID=A0AA38IED5_9CUCU|nr:hypothetical protein Zmor_018526 [Zophobas morio]
MLQLSVFLLCAICASAMDLKTFREELLADEDFMAARDYCLEQLGMKVDDLKLAATGDEVPENLLCFAKCLQEKQGYVDAEGTIDLDNMKALPVFSHIPDDKKDDVMACLENMGKIETCADIQKERECFHNNLN